MYITVSMENGSKQNCTYMRIYINKEINMHIYININIYQSAKLPHRNSCTWARDVRLHNAGINKPKSAQQVKQGA